MHIKTIILLLIITSCNPETCINCEVLNHKEIYIPEICGDQNYIDSEIEWNKKKYKNYQLRCQ